MDTPTTDRYARCPGGPGHESCSYMGTKWHRIAGTGDYRDRGICEAAWANHLHRCSKACTVTEPF